ncbi:MAG: hypothetical protein HZA46_13890 [Planctomycetales bacterium]|nr:hypothetical protein [Planctomycetales bacterium]
MRILRTYSLLKVVCLAAVLGALADRPGQALGQEDTARGSGKAQAPKVIRLGGHEFTVKDSPSQGPGPCIWSRDNVWTDDLGRVHLKLANRQGRFTVAEIRSAKPLGRGAYKWTISSERGFGQLDPNVVVGCFVFGSSDEDGEIDVEFGRFGEPDSGPGRFVVHPAKLGESEERFEVGKAMRRVVVGFDWRSDEVRFQASGTKDDGSIMPFGAWTYRGTKVPNDPNRFHAHCNLWLFKNSPPTDACEVEIVVEKFEFTPLAGSGVPKSNAGPSITVNSPTDRSTTSERLITVSGTATGLPKGARITVYVNTDQDYAQDEDGIVSEKGNWTSRYNVLGGFPVPFEHRVFATARVNGKTIRSNTVRVIKR